jgi:hypothetical protein
MDAVLPVTAASCARAVAFLLPSLRRHYRDLETLWVASPGADLGAVKALVQPAAPGFRVRFCADEDIVPEFHLHERLGFPRVGGWFRQQIVKLAFAEHVTSEFYLILDDDLLAVSDFGDVDCLPEGRALRGQDRAGHRARQIAPDSPDNLDIWLTWSGRVLQCPPLDYQPDVTPSILSRAAVRQLAGWLEEHCRPGAARWKLGALFGRLTGTRGLRSWRGRLLASLPWTEYTLYDTFLVRHGDFGAYHREPTDTLLLGNAAWNLQQFERWRPRPTDDHGRRLLFNLVASRSGPAIEAVAARLAGEAT